MNEWMTEQLTLVRTKEFIQLACVSLYLPPLMHAESNGVIDTITSTDPISPSWFFYTCKPSRERLASAPFKPLLSPMMDGGKLNHHLLHLPLLLVPRL